MRINEVTLCAFGSEKYKDQQQKALDYSRHDLPWGDIKNIIVDTNTIDEWNRAVVFDLVDHIDTPFALLIHPDGFVVHPESWWDGYLEYDYVGSPWQLPADSFSYRDIHGYVQRVGNSVSLRSKRLLEAPRAMDMEWKAFHGYTNEDGYICVNMRHKFERYGCKFAPLEVAKYFGREHEVDEKVDKPFVFHRHMGKNSKYPNYES